MSSFIPPTTTQVTETVQIVFRIPKEDYKLYMHAAKLLVQDGMSTGKVIIKEPKVSLLAREALKVFVANYMGIRFKILQNSQEVLAAGGNSQVITKPETEIVDIADEI